MSESWGELQARSSLLRWWPAVGDGTLAPVPQTVIVCVGWRRLADYLDGIGQKELTRAVSGAAALLGWPEKPVFLRTDQASAKHSYLDTCFLDSGTTERDLARHLYRLIDGNFCVGLTPQAIVVREYLRLDAPFTAWRGLPIARERRYFVRDGEVLCHHPYWPPEALESLGANPSIPNWRQELARLNEEPPPEVNLLSSMAADVGKALPGYWSIDFAMDVCGVWWLIDMAAGKASWHPECPHAAREEAMA